MGFDRMAASKNYYVKESVGIACGLFIAALHEMGLCTLTHTPSPMRFLSNTDRPSNEKPIFCFRLAILPQTVWCLTFNGKPWMKCPNGLSKPMRRLLDLSGTLFIQILSMENALRLLTSHWMTHDSITESLVDGLNGHGCGHLPQP